MKILNFICIFILFITFQMFYSITSFAGAPVPPDPPDADCIVPLIAGQTITVGEVIVVYNEDGTATVTYQTTDGWCITEAHVHAGCSLEEFPLTRKGSPKVGKFDYFAEGNPCDDEISITIDDPLCADPEDTMIATHAVVELVENGQTVQEETAWGMGDRFVDKGNWAMYFACSPPPVNDD